MTQTNIQFPLQRGAVLVVSLLILLVVTILALGASQSTRLQEKMAWNARDTELSFQAAEAALRGAEQYLIDTPSAAVCNDPTSASCFVLEKNYFVDVDLAKQSKTWWQTNAKTYGTASTQELEEVTEEPRYVIEELETVPFSITVGHGPPPGKTYYKSTAWSLGGTDTSQSVVESVFSRE